MMILTDKDKETLKQIFDLEMAGRYDESVPLFKAYRYNSLEEGVDINPRITEEVAYWEELVRNEKEMD